MCLVSMPRVDSAVGVEALPMVANADVNLLKHIYM